MACRLQGEVRQNDDIVVVRGADRYRNFFNKAFRMLRYVFEHPAGYTHVLKTDDDTWVQPSAALQLIHDEGLKYPEARSLYAGCFANFQRAWFRMLPTTHKWAMAEDVLPEYALPNDTQSEYLRYAHGYGYILSVDLVEHVLFESQTYFTNESSMPIWFRDLKVSLLEDFLIGLLVRDVAQETSKCENFQESCYDKDKEGVDNPNNCEIFQGACYADLAVRHLQADSPQNLHSYAIWHEYEMNANGRNTSIADNWNTTTVMRPVCVTEEEWWETLWLEHGQ
jgi:hypothetical protein